MGVIWNNCDSSKMRGLELLSAAANGEFILLFRAGVFVLVLVLVLLVLVAVVPGDAIPFSPVEPPLLVASALPVPPMSSVSVGVSS